MPKEKNGKGLPKEISFKYIIPDPCPQLYVNGAQGGVTHRLEVQINFYFERQAMPIAVTHPITEEGKLGKEDRTKRIQEHEMIRLIQSSLVMDMNTARSVATMLNDKADEIEKFIKGNKP